jgi:hypothetical protein
LCDTSEARQGLPLLSLCSRPAMGRSVSTERFDKAGGGTTPRDHPALHSLALLQAAKPPMLDGQLPDDTQPFSYPVSPLGPAAGNRTEPRR